MPGLVQTVYIVFIQNMGIVAMQLPDKNQKILNIIIDAKI
jgi:hypothetical protein